MGLEVERKRQAITPIEHAYWLHFRTLEPFIIKQLAESEAPILDLGCGDRPYRAHYPAGKAIGADIVQSKTGCVDVILEAICKLPFPDHSFATVLCTQVLEHVEHPVELLRESFRVLRPGGKLILTCPFVWELHERPHDFLRFSEYWLTKNLSAQGFSINLLERQGGDLATIGQMLRLALATRKIRISPRLERWYNRFWSYLDEKSHTECMPLNYGIVCSRAA